MEPFMWGAGKSALRSRRKWQTERTELILGAENGSRQLNKCFAK